MSLVPTQAVAAAKPLPAEDTPEKPSSTQQHAPYSPAPQAQVLSSSVQTGGASIQGSTPTQTSNAPTLAGRTPAHLPSSPAQTGGAPPQASTQLPSAPAQTAGAPPQAPTNSSSSTPTISGTININGAPNTDNIYVGNVRPNHTAEHIKDFIHSNAGIDKGLIKIQELSKNQNNPRSRAFKASVPKGKLHCCINLPWGTTVNAQPFRSKPKGTAAGATRRPAPHSRRPQPNHPPKRQPYHHSYQHPDRFGWESSYLQPDRSYYGPPQGDYYHGNY